VISRYPILSAGHWTDAKVGNRGFAYARIDIPGPHDLWAVSVHLLTSSSSNRAAEASQLVNYLQQYVPSGDYVVVGGDFNTQSRTEAAVTNFSALFSVSAPYPADQNGNTNTNSSRAHPEDWVLADKTLVNYQVPTVVGHETFNAGLVFDTRVFTPISDAAPALSGDSGASQMQHMGIVKDFVLP
jgi:endonuclease/exonuclease/phosphatase family metal-dependent hydrolase